MLINAVVAWNLFLFLDDTIEDMREEKVIMDFPEAAEQIIAANSQVKRNW